MSRLEDFVGWYGAPESLEAGDGDGWWDVGVVAGETEAGGDHTEGGTPALTSFEGGLMTLPHVHECRDCGDVMQTECVCDHIGRFVCLQCKILERDRMFRRLALGERSWEER